MSAVEVHAVVTGREDGTPVVLSNSLGSSHAMWDAQTSLLDRFDVGRAHLIGLSLGGMTAIVERWFTSGYLRAQPRVQAGYVAMIAATPARRPSSSPEPSFS